MRTFLLAIPLVAACSFDPRATPIDAPVDMPAVDAPPDAPVQLVELETLEVPADGTIVTSTEVLAAGRTYRLRATGTFVIDTSIGLQADADYYNFAAPTDDAGTFDVGLAIDDVVVDIDRQPSWGPYRADHLYEVDWPGEDRTIQAMVHDGVYANNSGMLTLTILEPQPR